MNASAYHEQRFTVRIHETGALGTVTIAAVADWLQDAATIHAADLGFSHHAMAEAGVAWVLVRLCIRMNAYPRLGQTTVLRTWPSLLDKRRANREFTLTAEDGSPLGAATSSWVAMDVVRRRLGSMPDFVSSARPEITEQACEFTGKALPRPDLDAPDAARVDIRARKADLDWNAHVNNVHLLQWALEPVADDAARVNPGLVDMAFRAEIRHGDGATACCAPHEGGLLHGLFRLSDGREAARMISLPLS
ncbi:acyl-[acyl-carrier-protein] thioesterase [Desulfocurvus sp. DL9XJH121]